MAVPSLPLTANTTRLIDQMLLDWLTAYEMGALIKVGGPTPWRFEAMEFAFTRSQE